MVVEGNAERLLTALPEHDPRRERVSAISAASRRDGLDLPSVYGVVKQSGGFIWIDSEVGQGTRITILLPPLGVEDHSSLQPSASAPRVLLVEDDEDVRELLIDRLRASDSRLRACWG